MRSKYQPQSLTPQSAGAELAHQRLEAYIGATVQSAVDQAESAYSARLERLESQVDFLLGRTHNLNTSAMAVLFLLMQNGVFTQSDLVKAATGYEGAMDLDRSIQFLRKLDNKLAKKRGAAVAAPPASPPAD